jgi:hypothetical protein
MTPIKLYLTDQLLDRLTEEAKSKGVPRQHLIAGILADHYWVHLPNKWLVLAEHMTYLRHLSNYFFDILQSLFSFDVEMSDRVSHQVLLVNIPCTLDMSFELSDPSEEQYPPTFRGLPSLNLFLGGFVFLPRFRQLPID